MQTLFYHQFYHLAVRFSKIPHPDNTYRTHKLLQNNLLCFVALQIIVWQNPGLCDDLASALQPVDSVTLPDSVTAIDVSNHLLPDNRYVQVSSEIYTKKMCIGDNRYVCLMTIGMYKYPVQYIQKICIGDNKYVCLITIGMYKYPVQYIQKICIGDNRYVCLMTIGMQRGLMQQMISKTQQIVGMNR